MAITHKVRDGDPAITCRRILLVVNAVGDSVPTKVIDWINTSIEGDDGDVLRVRAFALAASTGHREITPKHAVMVIRGICMRRLGATL